MRRHLPAVIAAAGGLILALGPPAMAGSASSGQTKQVRAEGDIFTNAVVPGGTLRFSPAAVSVNVGGVVRWTNTDLLVPHTVTEKHGLFDLAGSYGGTPVNPPGFGPGTSVQRTFDGGTFQYYCRVHPTYMHGVVSVADTVAKVQRASGPLIKVNWGAVPLPQGQVFDVQRREGGAWVNVRRGTTKLHGTFPGSQGSFRSRVRFANGRGASEWSPPAGV